ncbi:hypothetical protein ABU614_00740 [Lysobacter firmicutimachus]|uniref:Uncharacterized protein n=1 Tax=Lysobacter firmicutimachus TaxID=1792846 RepID=A0AAU8MUS4_9GAMM
MVTATSIQLASRTPQEYAEELFASVTHEQLRQVLASLYNEGDEVPSVRTRADAVTQIWVAGQSPKRIAEAVLAVEANAGMKHCFLAKLRDSTGLATFLTTPPATAFPLGRVQARLARVSRNSEVVVATIEHYVPVVEWIEVDADNRTKQRRLQRHPLVVRFYKDTNILTVGYPGFSQGSGTKSEDRVTYEQIIAGLLRYLLEKFNVTVAALPIHPAMMALQQAESPRVKIVRSELEGSAGKLIVSSDDDSTSVVDMVVSMLASTASEATKTEIIAAVSDGLKDASSNSLVAVWNPESVYTRVAFWHSGAELLFIWNASDPSQELVEKIVRLLSEVAIALLRPHVKDAWTIIGELKSGDVVTVGVLAARSNASTEDARKILMEAVRAALVVPVYRLLTTDVISSHRNVWTKDLASLSIVHLTDRGVEFDGTDPRNIEVGFRRAIEEPAA